MKVAILFACLFPLVFGNIVDDLNNEGLTTLVEKVGKAELVDAVLAAEPLTLFAPTNEAFDPIPADITKEDLKNTLLYHVIAKEVITSDKLEPENRVVTASGSVLTVNKYENGVVAANGKKVSKPDVKVGNGSIAHVVDEVIPFIKADDTIPAVLTREGNFATLLEAVGKADLVDTLSNSNASLTLFAPTDEAFEKVPEEDLKDLLKPENKQKLVDLLTTHVLPSTLYAVGIESGKEYQTVNEAEKIKIDLDDSGTIVTRTSTGNSAMVTKADLSAINGVIHAIDTVLL